MKFLIITPNLNCGDYLKKLFRRIIAAKCKSSIYHKVSWLIMDSNSTDHSLSTLRCLISSIGYHHLKERYNLDVRVISQKDQGMYDAINNGLRIAEEQSIDYDCFFWVNSDDYLHLESLDLVEKTINEMKNKAVLLICRGVDIDDNDNVIYDQEHLRISQDVILNGNFNYITGNWIRAESCIFTKQLIDKVGRFNADLRVAGDFDYIIRCCQDNPPEYADKCYGREFRRRDGQLSSNLRVYEIERKNVCRSLAANTTGFNSTQGAIGCIYFYPDYTNGNSYQLLLYENLDATGYRTAEDLIKNPPSCSRHDIFHVHWLNDIMKRERKDAIRLLDWLKNFIVNFKAKGGTVIWTIHNIHSHESKNLDLERDAYQFLMKNCDRCHMHDQLVAYEFFEYYKTLPWGKVRFAAHGSYPQVSGDLSVEILAKYGLCKGDQYIVVPGQLRRYKNLPLLAKGIQYMSVRYPDVFVYVLGQPHHELDEWEVSAITNHSNVIHSHLRLDDDSYALLTKGSLFSLLTYTAISTSGSAIHALSQGIRIVAPRLGTLEAYVYNDSMGYLYNNNDCVSMFSAIDSMMSSMDSSNSAQPKIYADWNTILPRILV
jgi:glycosyltransferase involved in cell wall biosynthesis